MYCKINNHFFLEDMHAIRFSFDSEEGNADIWQKEPFRGNSWHCEVPDTLVGNAALVHFCCTLSWSLSPSVYFFQSLSPNRSLTNPNRAQGTHLNESHRCSSTL